MCAPFGFLNATFGDFMSRKRLGILVLLVALAGTARCNTIRERVLLNNGHKLFKAQKYEEAIEEYKKILAFDKDNWAANYQIAMSYLAMYHPGSTHPKDLEYADKAMAGYEALMKLQAPRPEIAQKVEDY